jgi:hypothetical protein
LFSKIFGKVKSNIYLDQIKLFEKFKSSIYYIIIVFLLFRLFFQLQFGWLHGGGPYKLAWLSNFLPFGILITISYLLFFNDKQYYKKFIFLNLLYLISSVLIGSRSILFTLFFHFYFVTFIYCKNFNISFIKVLSFVIISGPILLIFWYLSNFLRGSAIENTSALLGFLGIFSRLGAPFDGLYLILNSNSQEAKEVFNVFWDFKIIFSNVINSILPGDLITTSGPNAGELFKVIYFQESLDFAMGDVWSGPGYLYSGLNYFSPLIYFIIILNIIIIILIKKKFKLLKLFNFFIMYYISVSFFAIGMFENFLTDIFIMFLHLFIFFIFFYFIIFVKPILNWRQ